MNGIKDLKAFWEALGSQRAWFDEPTIPYDDPVFCIRTKPGFIFDDFFWEVFHRFPFYICHVAYYGPERLQGESNSGVFELRFCLAKTRIEAAYEEAQRERE